MITIQTANIRAHQAYPEDAADESIRSHLALLLEAFDCVSTTISELKACHCSSPANRASSLGPRPQASDSLEVQMVKPF